MTRNLIELGLSPLAALVMSLGAFAGSIPDVDGDGVPDQYDNCSTLPNGPLAATNGCDSQEDGDGPDGYGNPCDLDPNNDGATGFDDVFDTIDNAAMSPPSTDPRWDANCDGAGRPSATSPRPRAPTPRGRASRRRASPGGTRRTPRRRAPTR